MPSSLLTNLNSAFSLSLQRAVRVKAGRNLVKALSSHNRHFGNKRMMSASGVTAVASGDLVVNTLISSTCGNVNGFVKPSSVCFGDKRVWNCRRGISSMAHVSNGSGLVFDITRRSEKSSSVFGLWLTGGRNVSLRCYSDGVVPEVSVAVSDEQESLNGKALKLISGSSYLPHPAKEKTGGEDAHFICREEQVIGVADGVGGWAELGVNAGLYAQELMSHSIQAIKNGVIDPAHVLEKAHKLTKAQGSSTACIIALTDEGLHAINLGDSGFIVVRDGRTIFESPSQQHSFNFTFQLENGTRSDLPSSGQIFKIRVEAGDVIVAGTDGLFDNLYNNEVSSTVSDAVLDGLNPDAMAQKIAALARQRALDKKRQTPFSTAAQEAGWHYYGGKLDDITVVVSYITE